MKKGKTENSTSDIMNQLHTLKTIKNGKNMVLVCKSI